MKTLTIYHYDAFTREPNKGNPAGIILNGNDFTEDEMQTIAFKVGFNEVAFLLKSDTADLKIRYFSPKREMDLCGHATISALYALKTRGLLDKKELVTIETKAGILSVSLNSSGTDTLVTMSQATPRFKPFKGSLKTLTHAMGIKESDIDHTLPILYGSTGTWTLLVPINGLGAFKKMKPVNKDFPALLSDYPDASVHPFCLETVHSSSDMHGRHFSSPGTGSVEDSVTGTASGVMGAYYAQFISENFENTKRIIVEQGQEMGKDGRVYVGVSKNNEHIAVSISGHAVYVKSFEVTVDKN